MRNTPLRGSRIRHSDSIKGQLGEPLGEDSHIIDDGWRDITGPIVVKGVGATDPDWVQIGSGPFWAYRFSLNDECWIPFHVPHDIKPGTDIHFHTHWLTDGTQTASVKWEFTYAYAKGFNQEAFDMDTGAVVTAEEAASGIAYQHMVTETAAVTIPTLTEPDGIIYVNLVRITNGGTNNTDEVFLLMSDIHYQSITVGTPGKAPDFYAES